MPVREFIVSHAAYDRIAIAGDLLRSVAGEIVVIGVSREAADDFVREIAASERATFGIHRFSLAQLASRLTRMDSARRGVRPAASLMVDALTARSCFESAEEGRLTYFAPVAASPGFPRAVRRTISELRLEQLEPAQVACHPVIGADVGDLLERYEKALEQHAIVDLAELYGRAATLVGSEESPLRPAAYLFLDVPVRSRVEEGFIRALVGSTSSAIATVAADDPASAEAFQRAGLTDHGSPFADGSSTLGRLQTDLFSPELLPLHEPDDCVTLFSAPGEAREAVEIVRAILREASRGTAFDEIAILLRNPAQYVPHLETASRRAGVPFYLASGARRPDPAGRAFLALLACGVENLSARRFAEYLSLGQVPRAPDPSTVSREPSDPALRELLAISEETEHDEEAGGNEAQLREPWKWEDFIIEAAVIGGADRWDRRLAGLEREYTLRLQRAIAEDPQGPHATFLRREIERLLELRAFAIPVIRQLEALDVSRTWGDWLDVLAPLARMTLKKPERVLRALADLRPMAEIGPVSFTTVVAVLETRLSTLERTQPPHRFGHIFIGPIEAVRGRAFRIVFVPGVSERAFPARLREDPILLDTVRAAISDRLELQEDRLRNERRLFRLAVGAARERLFVSYSRMDLREGRGRVSSFYALEVARAARGAIPDYEILERDAAKVVGATMAWPAPEDPRAAIDALEHDLSTLRPLLLHRDPRQVRGRANYLLQVHPHLGRALRSRRARWKKAWTEADGMWAPGDAVRALLQEHGLKVRPYSASAIERFAVCPYRFYLASIAQLAAREEPERIEMIDPRTRGTIVHAVYAAIIRALRGAALLPLSDRRLADAQQLADQTLDAVAARFFDELAPAIESVWKTEIEAIRTDARIWLSQLAESAQDWLPIHAELGFGIPLRDDLDPSSRVVPVVLADGWQLRGSIDLVEQAQHGSQLRIRDYKTGENKTRANLVVGGGEALQPTLYGLVAEQLLGRDVVAGSLWFVSSRAGFTERAVPLGVGARRSIAEVLALIDAAVRDGRLGAAPRKDACSHCDFLRICGPYEETRITKKSPDGISQLLRLREMP